MVEQKDKCLSIIRELLDRFHANEINYCHWKSNEHLHPALSGDTDLDILFEENQNTHIDQILKEAGFVRFNTAWFLKAPCIVDYFAIDPTSGNIVHVHAHFKLMVGEKMVKCFHLYWENEILSRRVWLNNEKIYTADPADEFVLLLVRLALKIPSFNINPEYGKGKLKSAECEYLWLKERVSLNNLIEKFNKKTSVNSDNIIKNIYQDGLKLDHLRNLSRQLSPFLIKTRKISLISLVFSRYLRLFFFYFAQANKRFDLLLTTNHRALPNKGVIVSFLHGEKNDKAIDTSSMTTYIKRKMDTVFVDFNLTTKKKSLLRRLVEKVFRIDYKIFKSKNFDLNHPDNSYNAKTLKTVFLAVSIAIENRCKLKRIKKHSDRGAIVICTGYPLLKNQYEEAPFLKNLMESDKWFYKKVASFERKCYEYAEFVYPDLIFNFIVGTSRSLNNSTEIKSESSKLFAKSSWNEIDLSLTIERINVKILTAIGSKMKELNS